MAVVNINGITGGSVPYTIKVYQVGNTTPIFTDTTVTNSYTGNFSHTNGQSYYAVVEKSGCTPYASSNTTLNCEVCTLTASFISYSCYSSTHYQVNFTISGGDGNYLYSLNGGGVWSVTDSTFSENIAAGTSSILISKSDFSCQTTVNLNPAIIPCELCFELFTNDLAIFCVSGTTQRKRVTLLISNNLTSGCPSGNYEYSDDNGVTWFTTSSSFDKIYDSWGANLIKFRYSLYPNKVWNVNVPEFSPTCNSGFYYVTSSCSCEYNGGVGLTGDWCRNIPDQYNNIPNSPSTYVASITNPSDGNSSVTRVVPIAVAFYSPVNNMRLVFSKTGGNFLNGTTTYDTGYIGGVYMFRTNLAEGETISFTIRSQSGGINCATLQTMCGASLPDVNSNSQFTWETQCSGLPNNEASIYWNESIIF